MPERWWRLRVTGAAGGRYPAFPEDLAGTHPKARVCMRRTSDPTREVCAPLQKIAGAAGDRDDRLPVLTSDIEGGHVEIRIEEGSVSLASGASAPNPDGLRTTVLCGGMRLHVGPRETATHVIRGFLDDE